MTFNTNSTRTRDEESAIKKESKSNRKVSKIEQDDNQLAWPGAFRTTKLNNILHVINGDLVSNSGRIIRLMPRGPILCTLIQYSVIFGSRPEVEYRRRRQSVYS